MQLEQANDLLKPGDLAESLPALHAEHHEPDAAGSVTFRPNLYAFFATTRANPRFLPRSASSMATVRLPASCIQPSV